MDNPTRQDRRQGRQRFHADGVPYDMTMKDMNDQAKGLLEAWKKNFPNKDPNVNATLGYTYTIHHPTPSSVPERPTAKPSPRLSPKRRASPPL